MFSALEDASYDAYLAHRYVTTSSLSVMPCTPSPDPVEQMRASGVEDEARRGSATAGSSHDGAMDVWREGRWA
eukprot:7554-Eustigmatos_ZCMA.PRE.1